jgi:hypothetical protein
MRLYALNLSRWHRFSQTLVSINGSGKHGKHGKHELGEIIQKKQHISWETLSDCSFIHRDFKMLFQAV